jgi:hypothetical protein
MAVEVPLSRAADPRIAPADEILSALSAHYAGAALVSVSTAAPDGELLLRQGCTARVDNGLTILARDSVRLKGSHSKQ